MRIASALFGLIAAVPLAGHAAQGDPPARVTRLTVLRGNPSIRFEGESAWRVAQNNFPVAKGASLWTPDGAGVAVTLPGIRVITDQATEFTLDTLTDTAAAITLPQGRLFLDLRQMAAGQALTVHTPRGDAVFASPGAYEADAGTTDAPTRMAVADGSAALTAPEVSLTVLAGQEADVTGEAPLTATVIALARDPFLTAMLTEERPRAVMANTPPIVTGMTGGEELAAGSWVASPQYGQVWLPPPEQGFVPYRAGHWADVPPWGWTWVDDAPWGYATTHYGRWVAYGSGWGWCPGEARDRDRFPVWAPAIVGFVSVGAAIGVFDRPPVAWVPLSPGERFRPYWRASRDYEDRLNRDVPANKVGTVINDNQISVTNITNSRTFINRSALTAVPASVVSSGAPVALAARGFDRFPLPEIVAATAPRTHPGIAPALLRPAPPAPRLQELFSPRVASRGPPGPVLPSGLGAAGGRDETGGPPVGIAARPELREPGAVPPSVAPRAGMPRANMPRINEPSRPGEVRPAVGAREPETTSRRPELPGPQQAVRELPRPETSVTAQPQPPTQIDRAPVSVQAPRLQAEPFRGPARGWMAQPQPAHMAPPRLPPPAVPRAPPARVAMAAPRPPSSRPAQAPHPATAPGRERHP